MRAVSLTVPRQVLARAPVAPVVRQRSRTATRPVLETLRRPATLARLGLSTRRADPVGGGGVTGGGVTGGGVTGGGGGGATGGGGVAAAVRRTSTSPEAAPT